MARFSRRVVVAALGALSLLAPAPRAVATAKTIPPPPAGFANLSVKDRQLAQSNITAGSRVAAKVTLSNEGTSNATPTTLKMWFSHSASGSMLDAKADLLSGVPLGIAPRRTVTYDATVTAPKGPQPGTYRIFAYVATTATEYTLVNTKRAATLVLSGPSAPAGPPPDPTPAPAPVPKADIMPSSLKLGTATIAAGGTTPVQLTVANRGTAPAGSVGVTISLVSGATTSRAASLNIGTLAAGASGTVVTMLTAPNQAGTYTVLAAATTPDPETSTANNTVTMTLTVTVSGAPTPAPQGISCDHYASPSGTGNGASASAPFRIADFWDFALPGKTLCLLDGTYRGADSMIGPAPGLSGASQHPITIRALNDGAVTIDGKFQRPPVKLHGNRWWVFEGFNAKNGSLNAGCTLGATINLTNGSNYNTFRRIVAWDTCIGGNSQTITLGSNSLNNTFEDLAVFGTGRKNIVLHGGSNNTICRRCWFRWEGSIAGGKMGTSMLYQSTGATFENVLSTWSGESMPESYTDENGQAVTNFDVLGAHGILTMDRFEKATTPKPVNLNLRGSISYTKATDRLPTKVGGGFGTSAIPGILVYGVSSVTLTDVVRVMAPTHPRFNLHLGIALVRRPHNCPGLTIPQSAGPCEDHVNNNTANRLTSIRGTATHGSQVGDTFGRTGVGNQPCGSLSFACFANEIDWTVTGVSAGASLAAVQSPWQNTSTNGARVCYRWGTTTPLWPWPMNERIKAATAAAGRYSGPCPTCVGGRAARTATDVTADIMKLLGPIPAACRR